MARRIRSAKERIAELRAKADQLERQDRDHERRRDTRRKILLGDGLLRKAQAGDPDAVRLCVAIIAALKERTRAPFEGWLVPGSSGAAGDSGGSAGEESGETAEETDHE